MYRLQSAVPPTVTSPNRGHASSVNGCEFSVHVLACFCSYRIRTVRGRSVGLDILPATRRISRRGRPRNQGCVIESTDDHSTIGSRDHQPSLLHQHAPLHEDTLGFRFQYPMCQLPSIIINIINAVTCTSLVSLIYDSCGDDTCHNSCNYLSLKLFS